MRHLKIIILLLVIGAFIPVTLSAARPDQGLILTVGPGGNHSTIQAAVAAALSSLGSSPIEIRVRAGTYFENIGIPVAMNQGSVILTGGWNAAFTSRDPDPSVTIIDGGSQGAVFDISPFGGELIIDGFTITNGGGVFYGAGLRCFIRNDARVSLNNNYIRNNTASSQDAQPFGGGIQTTVVGSGHLVLTNNLIRENRCVGPAGAYTFGGGLYLEARSNGALTIGNNVIENNSAIGDRHNFGIGVYIRMHDSSSVDFSDNLIRRNSARFPDAGGLEDKAGQFGIGGEFEAEDTSLITAKRNRWLDNVNDSPAWSVDVQISSMQSSRVLFTDSVLAGAIGWGMRAFSQDMGIVHLTNLTITDNRETGLYISDNSYGGARSLYNSIIFNNGSDPDLGGAQAGNNLIDVDPMFVNSTGRDYRLRAKSPAVDAGSNDPPGALGPRDLDGLQRIAGGTVDIGACELGEPDFALGFDKPTLNAERGTTVRATVNITRLGGFAGNVSVTPPDLSEIKVKPKPSQPKSTTESDVSFKLKVKEGAPVGSHQITFTGRDDSGREHTAMLTLVIQ